MSKVTQVNEIEVSSKEQFAATVRQIARKNGLNLIDAITSYCEDNEIQMEDVLPLLDRNLKEEIRVAAIDGRYVRGFKKTAKLF